MRFLCHFFSAGFAIQQLEDWRICYLLACGAMWCAEAALGIANPKVAFCRIANPTERGVSVAIARHSVLRVN